MKLTKTAFSLVLIVSLSIFAFSPVNAADGFSNGSGSWLETGPTNLSWTVSWDGQSQYVHYAYSFSVNQHDISHFTLELSNDFTSADITNIEINGVSASSGDWDLNSYSGGTAPQNTMPGDLYGIKFDADKLTTFTVEFDSTRMPEWGDYYARCGSRIEHELPKSDPNWKQWNSAWNAGFASGETSGAGNDPIVVASSGSYLNHILVPDSAGPTGDAFSYTGSLVMVPEPISTTLFLIGGGLLGGRRVFRKKK